MYIQQREDYLKTNKVWLEERVSRRMDGSMASSSLAAPLLLCGSGIGLLASVCLMSAPPPPRRHASPVAWPPSYALALLALVMVGQRLLSNSSRLLLHDDGVALLLLLAAALSRFAALAVKALCPVKTVKRLRGRR